MTSGRAASSGNARAAPGRRAGRRSRGGAPRRKRERLVECADLETVSAKVGCWRASGGVRRNARASGRSLRGQMSRRTQPWFSWRNNACGALILARAPIAGHTCDGHRRGASGSGEPLDLAGERVEPRSRSKRSMMSSRPRSAIARRSRRIRRPGARSARATASGIVRRDEQPGLDRRGAPPPALRRGWRRPAYCARAPPSA